MSIDRNKYMSAGEVEQLRETTRAQATNRRGRLMWMVVDMVLQTGLRVGELAALTIEDIDFERNVIIVIRLKKREKFNGGYRPLRKRTPVGYAPKLFRHLKEYLNGRTSGPICVGERGPLKKRGWQECWSTALRQAGLRHYGIHAGRHTLGYRMANNGVPLRTMQVIFGHSSADTTAIYTEVTCDNMTEKLTGLYD